MRLYGLREQDRRCPQFDGLATPGSPDTGIRRFHLLDNSCRSDDESRTSKADPFSPYGTDPASLRKASDSKAAGLMGAALCSIDDEPAQRLAEGRVERLPITGDICSSAAR